MIYRQIVNKININPQMKDMDNVCFSSLFGGEIPLQIKSPSDVTQETWKKSEDELSCLLIDDCFC